MLVLSLVECSKAGVASIVSAAVIGYLLGDMEVFIWSIGGAVAVMLFVGSEYQRSLNGTL